MIFLSDNKRLLDKKNPNIISTRAEFDKKLMACDGAVRWYINADGLNVVSSTTPVIAYKWQYAYSDEYDLIDFDEMGI